MFVIGVVQMVWLDDAIRRVGSHTKGLMQSAARSLDYEHAMTYVAELDRYSDYTCS